MRHDSLSLSRSSSRSSARSSSLGAVLPLVIMLLLAMLTLWLDRTVELAVPPAPRQVTHEPDYTVDKFILTRLSETGEPRYALAATRMLHYPDDDTSHLTRPLLTQSQPGKPETRINAGRGMVSADGREVRLFDQVELLKGAERGAKDAEELRVRTSYLRVRPDDDKADTPERVVIERGRSTLAGTGMDFDNRYRRIQLQQAVTGVFERKK
jgi:lipopolysaccharide export system protein LptC